MADALALEPGTRTLKHARREIEGSNHGIRIGILQEEARVATVATGGVEDAFAAAHIKAIRSNQSAGQRFVARDQACHGRQRTRQAIVVILNEALVVAKGAATRLR